jgi:uroporphyrinogen-III synthase
MPGKQITILSTRPLDKWLIDQAQQHNISIHELSFISTTPVKNIQVQQHIGNAAHEPHTVVFTSMNAAEAVAEYSKRDSPGWKIYCLGTATKLIVQQQFPGCVIAGTADNAGDLAERIIENGVNSVIFYCGDQRRNELPEKLADKNIKVEEIVVYETVATPHRIEIPYDGILFFSPSAVESFFSVNELANNVVLFAIGTTTAESIRKFSSNKIIQADLPGKDNLTEKAINYFITSKPVNGHPEK